MFYSRPEEVLQDFKDRFEANKGLLGFKYVATQDENLLPEYPALQIAMGRVAREDHGTQRFLVQFEATFWVFHANMESTHQDRNIEDMELATNVVRFLHLPENRALYSVQDAENKLIGGSGMVVGELPGMTLTEKGGSIVTTSLVWNGRSLVNYEDS